MSKRRISAVAMNAADWMKFRPYKQFDPAYDGYYLRLSNRIFNILNAPDRNLRQYVERTDLVELAVILASWFEDYANEVGFWNTFIHKNKELYGVWLPFFKMDQYDPEALNPEDPVKTELPLLPYLEFWMRFYSPDGFVVRFPNHKIITT
ncbi:MAG: DUF3843 family protein [Bacteroidota bacterium]